MAEGSVLRVVFHQNRPLLLSRNPTTLCQRGRRTYLKEDEIVVFFILQTLLYYCCQIEIYFDFGNVKRSRYSFLSLNVSYDVELGRSGIHGGGGLCNAFIVCFSQGQVSFSVVL